MARHHLSAAVRLPVATQSLIYEPFSSAGKPLLPVSQSVTGTCQGSDLLIRADAWRCFLNGSQTVSVDGHDGVNLLDPCFENASGGAVADLYCVQSFASKTAIALRLTKPLAQSTGNSPATSDMSKLPWGLVLTNGAQCSELPGATTVLDGMRQNYACSDGSSLYGSPIRGSEIWTIYDASRGATSLATTDIRSAYF